MSGADEGQTRQRLDANDAILAETVADPDDVELAAPAHAAPPLEACVYRAYLQATRADIPSESLWDLIVPNWRITVSLKSDKSAIAEGRYEADVDAVGLASQRWFVHSHKEVRDALSLWKDPVVVRGWINAEIRLETEACR
jgi:hypothetical protein